MLPFCLLAEFESSGGIGVLEGPLVLAEDGYRIDSLHIRNVARMSKLAQHPYGDLVEIPSGERFAINRAALSPDWRPLDCDGPWYIEQFSTPGARADWGAHVPNLEFVIAIAKCTLHRGLGEIIRYRTTEQISPQDLGRLRFLNVGRLP